MTIRSTGQTWALDIALAQGGFDALHPQAKGTLEQLGHDHTDFDKVFDLVRSGAMLPKAWATVAGQTEARAAHHERGGFAQTAADLYVRAAVMWGRAQYSIFDAADPRKLAFREHANHCVDRLGALRDGRVRRVVLDFEGGQIFEVSWVITCRAAGRSATSVRNCAAFTASPRPWPRCSRRTAVSSCCTTVGRAAPIVTMVMAATSPVASSTATTARDSRPASALRASSSRTRAGVHCGSSHRRSPETASSIACRATT